MTESNKINRRIVLKSRPVGVPKLEDFELQDAPAPVPQDGQLLLRTEFLSLDPYMRGRLSDAESYAAPVAVGDVIVGGTVSIVEESKHPKYQAGDRVLSFNGWQTYALSDGRGLSKLDPALKPASLALGVLGMPGYTAYMGLLDIGQPQEGETVVVAAASGPVGSVVGQIAKIKGCRVVGIAGGEDKCQFVVDELGFDACIDRKSPDLRGQISAACPKGIDIYFENVGGAVFNAVLPLLNTKARVPLCGLVAHYNDTELPPGPNKLPQFTRAILTKRLKIEGYIINEDYRHQFKDFFSQMSAWVAEGKVKYREDVICDLENAPYAFIGMLEGKNFGKVVVHVTRV